MSKQFYFKQFNIVGGIRESITFIRELIRGARGVWVIVIGNGHGDTSSNPGPD